MSDDYLEMLKPDPHMTPAIQAEIDTFPKLSRAQQVKFFQDRCGGWEDETTWNFYWQYIRIIQDQDDNDKIISEICGDSTHTKEEIDELEKQLTDAKLKYAGLQKQKREADSVAMGNMQREAEKLTQERQDAAALQQEQDELNM
ncbi:hypothetical protein SS50377_26459 [Spironucleus salmonicida]|uniref:Uncharacterized protein n=1 Tax=Spironucleus salmonicida TaxID=348837 RepID=V6LKW2_9EUKA|nr:hypothetical protein SS50377_26459 [Spironucleus salmonicida]|eukprot:EST41319.1 Hypothetical protein SS50377_19031 [Spironucleus salmonicida]